MCVQGGIRQLAQTTFLCSICKTSVAADRKQLYSQEKARIIALISVPMWDFSLLSF